MSCDARLVTAGALIFQSILTAIALITLSIQTVASRSTGGPSRSISHKISKSDSSGGEHVIWRTQRLPEWISTCEDAWYDLSVHMPTILSFRCRSFSYWWATMTAENTKKKLHQDCVKLQYLLLSLTARLEPPPPPPPKKKKHLKIFTTELNSAMTYSFSSRSRIHSCPLSVFNENDHRLVPSLNRAGERVKATARQRRFSYGGHHTLKWRFLFTTKDRRWE